LENKPMSQEEKKETFAEKYKIIKEIGRGTEGIIYLAQDLKNDRNVAVKQINIKNEQNLQTVLKEIETVMSLDHENIIKYFEYFKNINIDEFTLDEQVEIYLVMELCDFTLDEVIQQKRQNLQVFETQFLQDLIMQICSSLKEIHSKNIIHRDVKPMNIMIQKKSEEKWIIKLVDFGLAIKEGQGTGEEFVGTPLYVAPEITEHLSDKVDVYSFGVMLYELLTLRRPEQLLTDMTNIKLHQQLVKKLLEGYDTYFVEIVTMTISSSHKKRSNSKAVFNFVKRMKSTLTDGPVIDKESFEDLIHLDAETVLEGLKGDTQIIKDFMKDIQTKKRIEDKEEKKVLSHSQSEITIPTSTGGVTGIGSSSTGNITTSTSSMNMTKSNNTSPNSSTTSVIPVVSDSPRTKRRSIVGKVFKIFNIK
jgi:serine/threonine protein kinase